MSKLSQQSIKCKLGCLDVLYLEIRHTDFEALKQDILNNLNRSSNKTKSTPIIIDLDNSISITQDTLNMVIDILIRLQLIILGVKNTQSSPELVCSLPIIKTGHTTHKPQYTENTIHYGNIRSGQQIYAKEKSLVVMGAVSNGAEVAADGDIHIYGSLRGKAIAGASGNTGAKIFTLSCTPEIISIAGIYKVFDETHSIHSKAMLFLDNNKIQQKNI